jgi:hypothetical protein
MKLFAAVLLAVPFVAFAQTTKSDTFTLNSYVNLVIGNHGTVPVPNERSQVVYPCTTKAGGWDLYMNYFENSAGICACPSGAIESPRPFYRSKKTFETMDLRTTLNLADTTLFTRIDTVRKSLYVRDCALPFVIMGRNEVGVFVVTTYDHRYALVRLTPVVNTVECVDYVIEPDTVIVTRWNLDRLSGYKATWYLPFITLPNFSWIKTSVAEVGPKDRSFYPAARRVLSPGTEVYSLLGRKVAIGKNERERSGIACRSIYIIKDGNAFRPVLK